MGSIKAALSFKSAAASSAANCFTTHVRAVDSRFEADAFAIAAINFASACACFVVAHFVNFSLLITR